MRKKPSTLEVFQMIFMSLGIGFFTFIGFFISAIAFMHLTLFPSLFLSFFLGASTTMFMIIMLIKITKLQKDKK